MKNFYFIYRAKNYKQLKYPNKMNLNVNCSHFCTSLVNHGIFTVFSVLFVFVPFCSLFIKFSWNHIIYL